MTRFPYTALWTGRHLTLERDTNGDLYLVAGRYDGVRAPLTTAEAETLAAALNNTVRPRRWTDRFRHRSMRQVAGDGSTQIQIGGWPDQR